MNLLIAFIALSIVLICLGSVLVSASMIAKGKEGLIVSSILMFFIAFFVNLSYFMAAGVEVGEGYHDGNIKSIEKTGLFWVTNEGQLDKCNFSVDDDEVVEELSKINSSQLVRLHYKKKLGIIPWKGNTEYFVYKAEKL